MADKQQDDLTLTTPRDVRLPASPWAEDARQTLTRLGVVPDTGLTDAECHRRRQIFGVNRLPHTEPRAALAVLIAQLKSIVVLLLLGAAGLSIAFGDVLESLAILAVIAINTAIGFITELRAVRSIEALRKLGDVMTTVRRDGAEQLVPAESLVPGDIVLFESGDVITADMRLITAEKLEADESLLTGESMPVAKTLQKLDAATHVPDRSNMVFKGTSITRGAATAVVVLTGLETELGKISRLVESAHADETPLEKKLDGLGRRLVWVTLALTSVVAVAGLLVGRELLLAIQVAVALAVAAIPEGLPIVATIALARGVWRMAQRNVLVSKLSAVETLGTTNVILTDKTGTLTENFMTVSDLYLPDGGRLTISGTGLSLDGRILKDGQEPPTGVIEELDALLQTAALCNNATLRVEDGTATGTGDPTEIALLVAAAKRGLSAADLSATLPEVREEPFDARTGMMATFNRCDSKLRVHVKGAPEAVLDCCSRIRTGAANEPLNDARRAEWHARCHSLAETGLRTLAVATKVVSDASAKPYEQLSFLGLLGMQDPPRLGVRDALAECRNAGVDVIMVTGDHLATAINVARALGMCSEEEATTATIDARQIDSLQNLDPAARRRLLQSRVIARASPEQKLDLIDLYQKDSKVVAMIGDGVNDAPALKQADIGVAMGVRGTQVAKEAAEMVLQNDDFSSIVAAIDEGRAIYANIRKFVVYLLSCNTSEIMVVTAATAVGAPLPLLPLQILFLNLVTDVFPALALGVGRGATGLMEEKPRRMKEPVLTRDHWTLIVAYGTVMSITVLTAMYLALRWLNLDTSMAVTVSFLTLALAQLWHVLNMRERSAEWFRNEIVSNRWVWGAILLCLALLALAIYLPPMRRTLDLQVPGAMAWGLIIAMSLLPLVLGSWVVTATPPDPQRLKARPGRPALLPEDRRLTIRTIYRLCLFITYCYCYIS